MYYIYKYFALLVSLADRNLLVPMLVHFLYDFAAIYFTWLVASKEINERVEQAQQQLLSSAGDSKLLALTK